MWWRSVGCTCGGGGCGVGCCGVFAGHAAIGGCGGCAGAAPTYGGGGSASRSRSSEPMLWLSRTSQRLRLSDIWCSRCCQRERESSSSDILSRSAALVLCAEAREARASAAIIAILM